MFLLIFRYFAPDEAVLVRIVMRVLWAAEPGLSRKREIGWPYAPPAPDSKGRMLTAAVLCRFWDGGVQG